MIATLLPVLVSAALVEPATMRENRLREKYHQNENPGRFHWSAFLRLHIYFVPLYISHT
jgi:hypothetical protein